MKESDERNPKGNGESPRMIAQKKLKDQLGLYGGMW